MDKSCPTCSKVFNFVSRLKAHLEVTIHCKKTPEEIDSILLQFKKKANFKCSICNSEFTKKHNLQRHINNSKCKLEYNNIEREREKQIAILQNQIDMLKKPIKNINQPAIIQPIIYQPAIIQPIIDQPAIIQPIIEQQVNSQPIQIINNNHNERIINNNHNERIINNNNLTINNTIVQHIYPLGYEKLPNISRDKMIKLLELGDEGVIEIVKLVCEQDENKNFYKINMNKNNISFLSNQYKIDVCQETELKRTLLKQCVILTYQMLIACSPFLSSEKIYSINSNLQNMSTKMKEEIYDNGLKNIIEYELRNNNKITKNKIKNYTKEINCNKDIKQQAIVNYNNILQIKNNTNKSLTPEITLYNINNNLGDPVVSPDLEFEFTYMEFNTKRFEETTYVKYWNIRIKNELQYIKSQNIMSLCDIANFEERKKDIKSILELMEIQSNQMREYDNNKNILVNKDNFKVLIPKAYIIENERHK